MSRSPHRGLAGPTISSGPAYIFGHVTLCGWLAAVNPNQLKTLQKPDLPPLLSTSFTHKYKNIQVLHIIIKCMKITMQWCQNRADLKKIKHEITFLGLQKSDSPSTIH